MSQDILVRIEAFLEQDAKDEALASAVGRAQSQKSSNNITSVNNTHADSKVSASQSVGKPTETVKESTSTTTTTTITSHFTAEKHGSTITPKGHCRALFIGINYPGTHAALRGCVNDVKMMMRVLAHCGFPMTDKRVLVDTNDIPESHGMPTKANIIEGLQWLVKDAKAGDTLFLHYSGHGTQVKDTTGDEADGSDEALVPCDFTTAGYLLDDELVRLLVLPLPAGVRLTALLDCCHSGTLMDLPYTWVASEENMSRAKHELDLQLVEKPRWLNPEHVQRVLGISKIASSDCLSRDFALTGSKHHIPADVIMFSGCRDEQTSADVGNTATRFNLPSQAGPGGAGGACTSALTEVLMTESDVPYITLLEKMRLSLKRRRFTQVPQLSSSKPVHLSLPFSLFGSFVE